MFLDDCQKIGPLTQFRGPNLLVDEEDVRPFEALSANNVEYLAGQVRTRRGFGEVWNPAKAITALYNWLQSTRNYLMYFHSGTTVVRRDLSSSSDENIITGLAANGMVCAQAGHRLYMAFFNSSGLGATEGRCWDGNFTGAVPNVEKCFTAPLACPAEVGIATSEPAVGLITAGVHRIGVIFTTKNGYEVKPVYLDGANYISLTATGSKNGRVVMTPVGTWPNWCSSAQIIMTTASNLETYYKVPGATAAVGGGGPVAVTIDFSISDTTLAGEAEEATEYFNLLTQTAGTGPFSPFIVLGYNNRMVYITDILAPDAMTRTSCAYISNMYAPQWITTAKHLLNLPEFRQISAAFTLGGSLYLLGPSWTYAVSDSTDYPVKWAPPQLVDSRIGSPFIRGVCPNASRNWVWVADQSGLYCYRGGAYSIVPASDKQEPDWLRINFGAPPETLRVIDNAADNMVLVLAPLDGAVQPTHILAWDYQDGVTPDRIKYCGAWAIGGGYLPGDLEIVQAYSTKRKELWMAPFTAGKVLRQKYEPADALATIYHDDGNGYESYYQLCVSGVLPAPTTHVGDHLRVRGTGMLGVVASTLDGVRSRTCRNIVLGTTPGKEELVLYDLQSEAARLRVSNGEVAGAYFILSSLLHYMTPWMGGR